MKKAQFVSPIVILAIIIISTYIIITQTQINNTIGKQITSETQMISDLENITKQDLEYQITLTQQVLELASTINSSGTISDIMQNENVQITFNNSIIVDYTNTYSIGTNEAELDNTLIVPYPYNEFLSQELRFNIGTLGTCMGTDCTDFDFCVNNNYDTELFDWEPEVCLILPLRVKISITSTEHSLTNDFPYFIYNNSLIPLE